MRRIALIIALFLTWTIAASAGDKVYLGLGMNLLFPSDSGYKEIYGSNVMKPDIEIGYNLSEKLSIYGGFGYMTKQGTTIGELNVETKSTSSYLDLGLGYKIYEKGKFSTKINTGLSYIMTKEEALGEQVSGKSLGFRAKLESNYGITDNIFTGLRIGYIYGKDKIEGVEVKLGGLEIGVVLGFKF